MQEMAVNILRLQEGFLTIGPHLPGGPEQYFEDVAQRTFLIKSVLFNTQTLILDFVVVSRNIEALFLTRANEWCLLDLSRLYRVAEPICHYLACPWLVWSVW